MPKVHKTIENAARNLEQSIAVIPARYAESTGRAEWAAPAVSQQAEDNYQAGLAEATAKDLRRKNISAAGDTAYRKGCADKGSKVIGERIRGALGVYRQAFSPILTAMNTAADAAPAKTRDVLTNIQNRLVPVVQAARRAAGKE